MPIHLDGGNRGCEAIAKGTAKLLDVPRASLVGLSRDISLDRRLGVDGYLTLVEKRGLSLCQRICRKLEYRVARSNETKVDVLWKYEFKDFLNRMGSDDVMLSTGGDMMCYVNNEVIYTNEYVRKRGGRTVLWGCSMGPENLTPEKESTLHKFSLVYARESLSYEFFKSLGLENVVLIPDPAFVLEPESCLLPECFSKGEVIGVNLSNFVLGGYSLDSEFGVEVKSLLDYILAETDLQILLIPHVTWSDQDDRKVASMLMSMYEGTGRVSVLDIDNLNYCQIRHIIGKCRFFIGARTHAVISAYSMCVPTMALGYSIKSRGIAKDIGLDEYLVINSKKPEKGKLILSFERLCNDHELVSRHLRAIMPEYKNSTYGIRKLLR